MLPECTVLIGNDYGYDDHLHDTNGDHDRGSVLGALAPCRLVVLHAQRTDCDESREIEQCRKSDIS
jgi:hypothetical protein